MKKRFFALLCAILVCVMAQSAGLAASNTLELELDGMPLTLEFDPSEQFSSVEGGNVQASFFAYYNDSKELYELYMIFPQDVHAGDTVDPEYARRNAPESSVVMIVTIGDSVDYYFAGQSDGGEGTDYAMTFESVEDSGSERTYTGTLSASMVGMAEDNSSELKTLRIDGARFSFTMPLRAEQSPNDTLPPATDDPFGDDYDPFDEGADPTPAPSRETFRV